MSLKEITFISEYDGQYKTAPLGFSWTTLFFGFFSMIFRGDWKWGSIQFGLNCITFGLSWFVMPFFYNELYIKELLRKGFVPIDENQANYLVAKGVISRLQMEFFNKIRYEILKKENIL